MPIFISLVLAFFPLKNTSAPLPNSIKVDNTLWNDSLFDMMNRMSQERLSTLPEIEKAAYLKYKAMFEKNMQVEEVGQEKRIPKIIHFIWIGPKDFPEMSVKKIKSWINHHPDWRFIFWTDNPDRPTPCENMEKKLIQTLNLSDVQSSYDFCDNWGQKSDILRYVILKDMGGIYSDHDVVCLRSLQPLAQKFNLVAGLEDIHEDRGHRHYVFTGNCVIGASPNHPVLTQAIKNVNERINKIKNQPELKNDKYAYVITTTFASFFTATRTHADLDGNRDIILPGMCFFCTCITSNLLDILNYNQYLFCNHSFDGTW